MKRNRVWITRALAVIGVLLVLAFAGIGYRRWKGRPGPGRMADEASRAPRTRFVAPDEDYYHAMDGGANLALEEIQGRNT